ncbi:MAG: DUF559 domain-containing protein [Chloroflexi bacterium]|nr:DUF559 domain-containing protein [Chloroflexota bacterium]
MNTRRNLGIGIPLNKSRGESSPCGLVSTIDIRPQPDQKRSDELRTKWLEEKGYRVIRFWDNEVLTNIDGVFEVIRDAVNDSVHPHPSPLPSEGEGGVERPQQ